MLIYEIFHNRKTAEDWQKALAVMRATPVSVEERRRIEYQCYRKKRFPENRIAFWPDDEEAANADLNAMGAYRKGFITFDEIREITARFNYLSVDDISPDALWHFLEFGGFQ